MSIDDIYTTSELSELVNKNNKYIIRFIKKNDKLIEGRDYRKTTEGYYLLSKRVRDEIISYNKKLDDCLEKKFNETNIKKI